MAKEWKTGERIPLDHINELERKAEAYDRRLAEEARQTVRDKKAKPVESKE